MKSKLTFVKLLDKILIKLTNRLRVNTDISSHAIFNSIPYRRVVSQHLGTQEIFDLYQLGSFTALSSFLCQDISEGHEVKENIELVELQPKSTYRPHHHKNSSAVIYIVSGSGTFLLGDELIAYQAGKRIVIPAGFRHGFNTVTPTLFLSIQSPPIIDPKTGQIDLHYHHEEQP